METFSFIKFWRFTGKNRRETKRCDPVIRSSAALLNDQGADEGDDSFFELELSFTDFNSKNSREAKKPDQFKTEMAVPPFPIDHFSKKDVGHGDPVAKPQSPIALLKTGSKFPAFSSKKSMEGAETPTRTRSLNVRFKIDQGKESSASFPRETSFRITAGSLRSLSIDDMLSEEFSSSSSYSLSSSSSSKRFFNSLIRPLYTKSAKTQSSKKDNHVSSVASPASSPAVVVGREKQRNLPTGIWVVRKRLGKSRSASAAVGATSPASRVDESLMVQQDGIQSAILHCKRSFHGSRESSMLSRSTSDSSSQEKISTSSSEDSYAFSRISSCSASERSTAYEKIDES